MTRDPKWARVREEILLFCHRMQQERLVWYTAGNISARVEGEQDLVAVTPTSVPYDTMVPDDIVIMSVHGNIIDGFRKPTSEVPLHTLVYLRRPEVGGVVHTHSSAGMAMAAMGRDVAPDSHGPRIGRRRLCRNRSVRSNRHRRNGRLHCERVGRSKCLFPSAPRRSGYWVERGAGIQPRHSVVEGAADAYLRAAPLGLVPELSPEEGRVDASSVEEPLAWKCPNVSVR